jgi:hypothetical protein
MSTLATSPAARSSLFGPLRRNPTMASLDFTTGIAVECPRCHYAHNHRKTTIHLSHRGNFCINPVDCEQCGTSMIKIGSCFLPFPFNSTRARSANRSILSALATSAQVFGAVGSPAINVSQAATGSDSAQAIRRHLMQAMSRFGLPEKFQHFILRLRPRQTSTAGIQNQVPLLHSSDNAGTTSAALLDPVSQHATLTSGQPSVSEFDFAHRLPFSARRRSAPPTGEIHRCDCFGSCHCPLPAFAPTDQLRPYVAGDRNNDATPSSRSTASDPKPPGPNDLNHDLLHLGFGHLDVPRHGSSSNRLSQTNTEFSDGSSVGILEDAPPRSDRSETHQNAQAHGDAVGTSVDDDREELNGHHETDEHRGMNGYHDTNGLEEVNEELETTNEYQPTNQDPDTEERPTIARHNHVNGVEPYTNETSNV